MPVDTEAARRLWRSWESNGFRSSCRSEREFTEYAANNFPAMLDEIETLRKKCECSLANNLCPDHRDKQQGKLCLACEIERLQNQERLHV